MTPLLTLAHAQPKERKRFIKFMFVGALGFIVDFTSFNLLHAMQFGKSVVAGSTWITHPEVVEQAISFCLAVLSNFIWNYFWIYPEARKTNQALKLTKFALVSVVGLAIGIPVFTTALGIWRNMLSETTASTMRDVAAGNLALMTRVGVVMFWNFFANRLWTYQDVE